MATLKVRIKNSQFVDYSGGEVELFTPTNVKGNGWECYINDKGNITCIAQHVYGDVKHTIKLNIKNGWVKLRLKIGEQPTQVLKSYKLESDYTDGLIGLPGGYIDRRRAYFRDSNFQEFLDSNKLDAVNFESANVTYVLYEEFYKGESIYKEEIEYTDGRTELVFNDIKKSEQNEEGSFRIVRHIEVRDASWAIKKVVRRSGIQRILYTNKNPKQILNLPKP